MLELLDDGNNVNDAEEMEILYLKAKSTANTDEKAETLKKAFELYQGCLFELGELDMGSWLIPYTTHYNQVFIDITRELLAMLGHSRDYHRVIEYASRALSLEPGIQDAYYWRNPGCVLLDLHCCRSDREQYDEGSVRSDGQGRTAGRRVSESTAPAGDTNT